MMTPFFQSAVAAGALYSQGVALDFQANVFGPDSSQIELRQPARPRPINISGRPPTDFGKGGGPRQKQAGPEST
jgi:hypothetical protein